MTPDFNSISHLIEKVDAFKTPDGELFETNEQAIAHIMYQLTHKIVPESKFPSWINAPVTALFNGESLKREIPPRNPPLTDKDFESN